MIAGDASEPAPARLHLDATAAARGFRLETVDTIGSTNDGAFERAEAGDPGRLWLVAGEQTGGRGRHGRHWSSPPGNLYATLLLVDPAPLARVAQLSFVGGVALATAVARLGIARESFGIKWPNDLVGGGAKFSGLLLETRQLTGRLATVIGFGVNCASHPDGLAYPTTDLSCLAGRPVAPADLFPPLSRAVVRTLDLWRGGAAFDAVCKIWLDFAAGLGDVMRVDTGAGGCEGVFVGIDPQGRLLLRTAAGTSAIDAGDVFFGRR